MKKLSVSIYLAALLLASIAPELAHGCSWNGSFCTGACPLTQLCHGACPTCCQCYDQVPLLDPAAKLALALAIAAAAMLVVRRRSADARAMLGTMLVVGVISATVWNVDVAPRPVDCPLSSDTAIETRPMDSTHG